MVGSAMCAIAQTAKDYYQPSVKRVYETEANENALSRYTDGENDVQLSGFQRDAGLTLRNDKQIKKSGKKLEKAYERSAKDQKVLNQAEYKRHKKNQRAYLQENRKTTRKAAKA
jgi:hypothetical protein